MFLYVLDKVFADQATPFFTADQSSDRVRGRVDDRVLNKETRAVLPKYNPRYDIVLFDRSAVEGDEGGVWQGSARMLETLEGMSSAFSFILPPNPVLLRCDSVFRW